MEDFLISVVAFLLSALLVMWSWNGSVVYMFHVPHIHYIQAIYFLFLVNILRGYKPYAE